MEYRCVHDQAKDNVPKLWRLWSSSPNPHPNLVILTLALILYFCDPYMKEVEPKVEAV